jgi:hypothetical protein
MHKPHKKLDRKLVAAKMRADGIQNPAKLLRHRYLVRLAIRNTGGGPATHSEVAVRFRTLPKKAVAKAWADRKERNRAQLGGYSRCKFPKKKQIRAVGRTCPVKYNGRGFVDVTKAFTERNILFVHDPGKPNRANTIAWVATDRPQKRIWYYVLPGAHKVKFGFGKLVIDKYAVTPASKADPAVPPNPVETDDPDATPPATKSHTPRPQRAVSRWKMRSAGHRQLKRSRLLEKMQADRVPNPGFLLKHPYLVRLAIQKTGKGSASYSEVQVRFTSKPRRALGRAWADRNDLHRAQMGALSACRRRKKATGAMNKTHWCPVHFNGLGWRNLSGAFTAKTMLICNDPNNPGQAGTIIWAAFDKPQTNIAYRIPPNVTGAAFGLGQVSLQKFFVQRSGGPPHEPPAKKTDGRQPVHRFGSGTTRPNVTDKKTKTRANSWRTVAKKLIQANQGKILRYMRRDGLRGGRMLLRYPYLVRIQLRKTGGGTGRRSEVTLRFKNPISQVFGKAWADSPQMGRAQIGTPQTCRTGLYKNLPRGWRTCPVHFNNLGWRSLSSGVAGKKTITLINQPAQPYRAHTVLWLAFKKDPGPIQLRSHKKAGRYTLRTGRMHIWRVKVRGSGAQGFGRRGGRYRHPAGPGRYPHRYRRQPPGSPHGPPPDEDVDDDAYENEGAPDGGGPPRSY